MQCRPTARRATVPRFSGPFAIFFVFFFRFFGFSCLLRGGGGGGFIVSERSAAVSVAHLRALVAADNAVHADVMMT